MNPGGDYGKKELSPALRNRFTEIWVPHVDIRSDLVQIINAQWKDASLAAWTEPIIDFSDWFIHQIGGRDQSGLGLRDLLTWASFMNEISARSSLDPALAFAHGASLTIIDGLGALPATAAMTASGLEQLRDRCLAKVAELIAPHQYDPKMSSLFEVEVSSEKLRIGPFSVPRGQPDPSTQGSGSFSFGAKTSASNAMRVLRALSVPAKSVLLEGSPGAGKTSLITALAAAAARPLTRINLSDQTELVDLFGSDMPLEGGGPGEFAWRDAAFLTAMQQGEWVLLDEMNLASQTVLEGLNSCLDHRGTVYVPELGRSFAKHPDFRIFAAQNPHHQGGGRKGLPKSSFPGAASSEPRMVSTVTANHVRIGHAVMPREPSSELQSHRLALLQSQLPVLEALIDCVQKKWLSILVGPTGSGKTGVVRLVAQLAGARLEEFQMNSGTDTMDLIGTFEQFDPSTRTRSALAALVREAHRLSEQVAARSHSRYASFLTAQGTLKAALDSSQSSPSSEVLSAALEDVRNATDDVSDEVFRTTLENAVAVVTEMTQNTQDAQKSTGRFEWIDGPLLRALQEGHWLMLDNANLCSASVLDRLNSLFETERLSRHQRARCRRWQGSRHPTASELPRLHVSRSAPWRAVESHEEPRHRDRAAAEDGLYVSRPGQSGDS
ncbi:hypothetical protein L1887_53096 [Cichorium endivia]|nr:hypothetical protein L1887_53096 [Cichorium endivia]